MVSQDDLTFIRRAIALSQHAVEEGNGPYGALLVHENKILIEGWNKTNTLKDKTLHAEMDVLRQAYGALSQSIISKATLYSSTEPCAMCAGGLYWSGVKRVVFGCSIDREVSITKGALHIPCAFILDAKPDMDVCGPVLEDEAAQVHIDFVKLNQ